MTDAAEPTPVSAPSSVIVLTAPNHDGSPEILKTETIHVEVAPQILPVNSTSNSQQKQQSVADVADTAVAAAAAPPPPRSKSKKKKGSAAQAAASASQSGEGENTGRWTAEEHRLFLQGLEQHGKGWKKIASLIKSRTVVQIRTHAQKYFQKLAKARQNGEEGDVTMEGRGGGASVASSTSNMVAQTNKRKRQVTGTKRKAIQSVVASAQRQGKKVASAQATAEVPNPIPPLPAIAPALAHFVPALPVSNTVPDEGPISNAVLEESLFRFLTPVIPNSTPDGEVNDVARQAGANPITLPSDNQCSAPAVTGGEVSPTGVTDVNFYPSWIDAKDTPSWYAKGADVDALLDIADTLDWLTDTGDLSEIYHPPATGEAEDGVPVQNGYHVSDEVHTEKMNHATSTTTLPRVDSNVDSIVPSLPDLFDGVHESTNSFHHLAKSVISSSHVLQPSASVTSIGEHLQVFDSPLEEHDFVATILQSSHNDVDEGLDSFMH